MNRLRIALSLLTAILALLVIVPSRRVGLAESVRSLYVLSTEPQSGFFGVSTPYIWMNRSEFERELERRLPQGRTVTRIEPWYSPDPSDVAAIAAERIDRDPSLAAFADYVETTSYMEPIGGQRVPPKWQTIGKRLIDIGVRGAQSEPDNWFWRVAETRGWVLSGQEIKAAEAFSRDPLPKFYSDPSGELTTQLKARALREFWPVAPIELEIYGYEYPYASPVLDRLIERSPTNARVRHSAIALADALRRRDGLLIQLQSQSLVSKALFHGKMGEEATFDPAQWTEFRRVEGEAKFRNALGFSRAVTSAIDFPQSSPFEQWCSAQFWTLSLGLVFLLTLPVAAIKWRLGARYRAPVVICAGLVWLIFLVANSVLPDWSSMGFPGFNAAGSESFLSPASISLLVVGALAYAASVVRLRQERWASALGQGLSLAVLAGFVLDSRMATVPVAVTIALLLRIFSGKPLAGWQAAIASLLFAYCSCLVVATGLAIWIYLLFMLASIGCYVICSEPSTPDRSLVAPFAFAAAFLMLFGSYAYGRLGVYAESQLREDATRAEEFRRGYSRDVIETAFSGSPTDEELAADIKSAMQVARTSESVMIRHYYHAGQHGAVFVNPAKIAKGLRSLGYEAQSDQNIWQKATAKTKGNFDSLLADAKKMNSFCRSKGLYYGGFEAVPMP